MNPVERALEEDVGAETPGLDERAVVQDHRVEVRVARRVAATAGVGLADPASPVDEDLVEAASVGLVCLFIAEVPLAEDAGGVARILEHLDDRGRVETEPLAFVDRVRYARAKFVPPGH